MHAHTPFVAVFATLALLQPLTARAQERFSLSADRVAVYDIAGEVRVEPGTDPNLIVEVTRGGDDARELRIERLERDGWQLLVVRSPDRSIVYRGLGRWSRTEFGIAGDGTFGLKNLGPELGPDRVTAKADDDRRDQRVSIRGSGRGLEAHADVRVLVPAGKAVAVHLGAGKVIVRDVAADLQVDVRSGPVSVQQTQGFLRVDTGSGSVTAEQATGDVALNTGSGSVRARGVGNGLFAVHTGSGSVEVAEITAPEMRVATGSGSVTAAEIKASMLSIRTGSGGIQARSVASSKFDLHTGSGSINLDLQSDVDMGRIHSGSGGVTVTASRALGAELSLDTGSGGIDVDVPFDLIERRKSFLRARVGDGRGTLEIGTGSGGISIR